ncbi:HAAS signaling domain-containing protein [Streptomyces werraensis]|uniref:HAAS signaling domain-containing protein n=1 Tax=Streptomyces werraensis TaxID=68284 RepID=UPI0037D387FF
MSLKTSQAVQSFLTAVEREASALPAERRQELLADLAEHIEVALFERPGQEQAILAELGDPRTIASTALDFGTTVPQPPHTKRPGTVTALRSLLCIQCVIVLIAVTGLSLGYYPGPLWYRILTLLPALVSAAHVFYLKPGRSVLRITLTVSTVLYFIVQAVNVAQEAWGGVIGLLLASAVLALLHARSTRAWLTVAASPHTSSW